MSSKQFSSTWNDNHIAHVDGIYHSLVAALPPLLSLTREERQSANSISDGRMPYADKCLEGVKEHAADLNLSAAENTAFLKLAYDFEKLIHYRRLIDELATALRDTAMWVGGEYYAQCGIVHDCVRLAVRKGKPGIRALLDDLDKLYASNGHSHAEGTNGQGPADVNGNGNIVGDAA